MIKHLAVLCLLSTSLLGGCQRRPSFGVPYLCTSKASFAAREPSTGIERRWIASTAVALTLQPDGKGEMQGVMVIRPQEGPAPKTILDGSKDEVCEMPFFVSGGRWALDSKGLILFEGHEWSNGGDSQIWGDGYLPKEVFPRPRLEVSTRGSAAQLSWLSISAPGIQSDPVWLYTAWANWPRGPAVLWPGRRPWTYHNHGLLDRVGSKLYQFAIQPDGSLIQVLEPFPDSLLNPKEVKCRTCLMLDLPDDQVPLVRRSFLTTPTRLFEQRTWKGTVIEAEPSTPLVQEPIFMGKPLALQFGQPFVPQTSQSVLTVWNSELFRERYRGRFLLTFCLDLPAALATEW